ncbi:MAG: hypothetical protein LBI67_02495 [Treponema sp.]|jgi:hypothetical protein|nr:hypothetical protein [Treponema sp.]
MKKAAFLFLVFFRVFAASLGAAEFVEGRVRLVLNENIGRFSLYYMADIAGEEYVALFADKDPRTSFLAVQINDRNYRLGDTSSFKTTLGGSKTQPSLVFNSRIVEVTEDFSFITTSGSNLTNGVKITITITNKGKERFLAGARLLLDTELGETETPFSTDRRQITSEAQISPASGESFWVSGGAKAGLMGSASVEGLTAPDLVHFANWKRLNDAPWKTPFYQDRNFNLLPYSVGDSAVCYYYEPVAVEPGEARTITLVLASRDENGFSGALSEEPGEISRLIKTGAGPEIISRDTMQEDLVVLRDLAAKLDSFIKSGESVSEEELSAIELVLSRLKAKYGL